MKDILFFLATILFCFGFTACEMIDDSIPLDTSPAGSVSMNGYFMDAEFSYNGRIISDSANRLAELSVHKITDESIMLSCGTGYGAKEKIVLRINDIPLSGEAFNVAFDYSTNEAEGQIIDEQVHAAVNASVKGWIKRPNMINAGISMLTSPARPDFLCDITITCQVDNKHVIIKIKAVRPHSVST